MHVLGIGKGGPQYSGALQINADPCTIDLQYLVTWTQRARLFLL